MGDCPRKMMQIHDDFLKDQTDADEFVDWWLWQKAHEALRIQFNKPNTSLLECVREIQWLKLGMIPIVVAKAEHILGLMDGDNEAYEFVHGYDRYGVAEDNPYFIKYRRDRFSVTKPDVSPNSPILENADALYKFLDNIIPRQPQGRAEYATFLRSNYSDEEYPRFLALLEELKARGAVGYREWDDCVRVVIHTRTLTPA